MAYRPHGKAEVNLNSPRAWGTCDVCGLLWNLYRLTWQFQYQGPGLINQRYLACPTCLDKPSPFLKTIVIPPDPKPILNARPEPYAINETQVRFTIDDVPRITQDEEEYRVPDNSTNES